MRLMPLEIRAFREADRVGTAAGGVAMALVRAAEAGMARLGCPKVNLQVRGGNAGVTAFYRAAGYETDDNISLGKRLV